MQNDMLLKDYKPVSMLTVNETIVSKPKFPVFDAHVHIGPLLMEGFGNPLFDECDDVSQAVRNLKECGVVGVVNLKMFWGEPLTSHLKTLEGYQDFIHTFASVDTRRMEEPGFAAYVDELLKEFKNVGINGLKLWKNLGCTQKDSAGKYVLPDDERLFPIWEAAAKHNMLVLYHIADPKAFFTPVDGRNEFYECLMENPDWVFYGDDRYTFDELMQSQDNLLTHNPDTLFVIPHVGSNSDDLAWVGAQLDKHSNMYIDTAARNNLLGRQPFTAREFFIKYQDRILFGTDISFDLYNEAKQVYSEHYRFFETRDEYFRTQTLNWGKERWNLYGLGLPDDMLKKFYFENAAKLLKRVGINI